MGPVIAIALVTLVLFAPLLTFDFTTWDDRHNFTRYPAMNPPTWATVAWHWANPYKDLYVPVTHTVWAAVGAASYAATDRLHSGWFHGLNVVLHAGAAVVAYLLLWTLTRSRWAAWLGAIVYAVHPVQVEPVAWASGTKDVLSGMLSLVALWQYVRAVQTNGRRRAASFIVAAVAFVLAMLSKPGAVVLPLVAGLIDVFMLKHCSSLPLPPGEGRGEDGRQATADRASPSPQPSPGGRQGVSTRIRGIAIRTGAGLLLALPFAIIAARVQVPHPGPHIAPVSLRPLVALDAIAFYARQVLAPVHLAIDYGRSPTSVIHSGQHYFTWLVPAVLVVLAWKLRHRVPAGVIGLAIFVAALLPVLGFVPFDFQSISTTADHYLYLPLIGVSLIVSSWLAHDGSRRTFALVGVVAALLAGRSLLQARHWADSESLFQHTLAINPRSSTASINLGVLRMDQAKAAPPGQREALYEEAIACFEAVTALDPGHYLANRRMADAYYALRRFDRAAEHYRQCVDILDGSQEEFRDERVECLTALGANLALLGHLDEAAQRLQTALALDPAYEPARKNLAVLQTRLQGGGQPAARPPATRPD